MIQNHTFISAIEKIVKLCVHFCVCVSKSLRKWTQTDTKVTFHQPDTCHRHHHPPEKLFWSQMKGMAKIRLFYSGAMVLILPRFKDITHFVVYDSHSVIALFICLSFCLLVLLLLYCPSNFVLVSKFLFPINRSLEHPYLRGT